MFEVHFGNSANVNSVKQVIFSLRRVKSGTAWCGCWSPQTFAKGIVDNYYYMAALNTWLWFINYGLLYCVISVWQTATNHRLWRTTAGTIKSFLKKLVSSEQVILAKIHTPFAPFALGILCHLVGQQWLKLTVYTSIFILKRFLGGFMVFLGILLANLATKDRPRTVKDRAGSVMSHHPADLLLF